MRTMITGEAPVALPHDLFTLPEAAWAANTRVGFIKNEVDKKVVIAKERGLNRRLLDQSDLYYFRAMNKYHGSIDVGLRKEIYAAVCEALHHLGSRRPSYVQLDLFVLQLGPIQPEIEGRIDDIKEARAAVSTDVNIRSGEPCVMGTRIPVHTLQEIVRNGGARKELAVEYGLSVRQIEMAILYAELHPRRGRPAGRRGTDGLVSLGDAERIDIESLGEFPRP